MKRRLNKHINNMIIKFFIYGLLGWAGEILYTGLGSYMTGSLKLSGHTYLWMFPIYGMAVFLEPIQKRMRNSPWIVRGIIWAGIIFFIEYLSGWVLKLSIGMCPWDYSNFSRYTMDGFIRLDYLPIWFTAGLIFEKISGWLNRIQIICPSSTNHDQSDMIVIMKDGKDFLESNLAARWKVVRKKLYPGTSFMINSKPISSDSSNIDKRG